MQVEFAVDRNGFGRLKIGNVECAVQPIYQVPVEQYPRLDEGVENARQGL